MCVGLFAPTPFWKGKEIDLLLFFAGVYFARIACIGIEMDVLLRVWMD